MGAFEVLGRIVYPPQDLSEDTALDFCWLLRQRLTRRRPEQRCRPSALGEVERDQERPIPARQRQRDGYPPAIQMPDEIQLEEDGGFRAPVRGVHLQEVPLLPAGALVPR